MLMVNNAKIRNIKLVNTQNLKYRRFLGSYTMFFLLRFDLGLDLIDAFDDVLDLRLHPHDRLLAFARLIRHRLHLFFQRPDLRPVRMNPRTLIRPGHPAFGRPRLLPLPSSLRSLTLVDGGIPPRGAWTAPPRLVPRLRFGHPARPPKGQLRCSFLCASVGSGALFVVALCLAAFGFAANA